MKIGRMLGSMVNALTGRKEAPHVLGTNSEATPPEATGVSAAVGAAAGTTGESWPMTQAPAAWLLFQSGPNTGQSVPLGMPSVSVGRSTENDVVIEDAAVSRTHARISRDGDRYYIEDMGSMSGTLVDGATVTKTLLVSGGSLKLGETQVVFMQAESPSLPGTSSGPEAPPRSPAETMVIQEPQGLMAWLAITSGPQKGKTYQIKVGDNSIGRDPGNDLGLEDSAVSKSHAMIKAEDGKLLLMDLGSRGGTRVQGKTMEARVLKPGRIIGVGQTQLKLVDVEPGDPGEHPSTSGETIIDQPSANAAVLVVQAGPDAGKSFPVAQGDNVIGRDPDSAVLLTDSTVSRKHAMIRCGQDRTVVYDLGSRTGTQVDGEAVVGYSLSPGYTISVGHTEMVLMTAQHQQK